MKTWKQNAFFGIVVIMVLAFIFTACDDGKNDDPKPQSQTITFGANLSTNVTGHMTNSQWDNVIGKLTTALEIAAADNGNLGIYCAGLFGQAGVNIDLVKTQEFNYYKADLTVLKIFLNADYVIGVAQADLSAKVAVAINAGYDTNIPDQE